MTNQLSLHGTSTVLTPPSAAGIPGKPAENPLRLVHRHLRGRYPLAILVGLLLAVPGAFVGWHALPPLYQSTGIIRVAPTLPKILYQYEDNQMLPMFDSFVATQAAFLQSRRVLEGAIGDDDMRRAGWPGPPQGAAELGRHLTVNNRRGSELIHVVVKHRIPRSAQTAVNAVMESYFAIEEELNGASAQSREEALRKLIDQLDSKLAASRRREFELAEVHGTAELDSLQAPRVQMLARLDASIDQLEMHIANAASRAPGEADPSAPILAPSLEALAESDTVLRTLLTQKEHLLMEIDRMSAKAKENHPSMVNLLERLRALEARIASRAEMAAKLAPAGESLGSDAPIDDLKSSRDRLVAMRNATAEDLKGLAATAADLARVREEASNLRRDRDEARERLKQMEVERNNTRAGRISTAQRGDLPTVPATDRRIPLTIFGAAAGLGSGLALVWGYGLLRGGYRFADELQDRSLGTPILGVIPELTDQPAEHDEDAAMAVHHVRAALQLQLPASQGQGRIVAVTSGAPGEGKTHLSMALGLSFAMAGDRTLLIDADLLGRSLSEQLGLSGAKGVSEAIRATSLNGEIHSVRDGLWALPAGISRELRPEELSSALVERLLERAKRAFDTVIVDTGPVLGSLEASLVSANADGVVLVVARGQSPAMVRSAVNRIASTGGRCLGLLFNRAMPQDFRRSTSATSTSRRLAGHSAPNGSSGRRLTALVAGNPADSDPS